MNNVQLYLSIGVPTFAVVLAWMSNRADNAALRAEMIALRRDMQQEITTLRSDMNRDMTAFRREIHNDFTEFRREMYQEMIGLHERVVKVETKQDNS